MLCLTSFLLGWCKAYLWYSESTSRNMPTSGLGPAYSMLISICSITKYSSHYIFYVWRNFRQMVYTMPQSFKEKWDYWWRGSVRPLLGRRGCRKSLGIGGLMWPTGVRPVVAEVTQARAYRPPVRVFNRLRVVLGLQEWPADGHFRYWTRLSAYANSQAGTFFRHRQVISGRPHYARTCAYPRVV